MTRFHACLIAALVILSACAGCASDHTINVQMEKHNMAEVVVLGSHPDITVTNRGPGSLAMRVCKDGTEAWTAHSLDHESVKLEQAGPVRISMTTSRESGTLVSIRATGTSGVSLRSMAQPIR